MGRAKIALIKSNANSAAAGYETRQETTMKIMDCFRGKGRERKRTLSAGPADVNKLNPARRSIAVDITQLANGESARVAEIKGGGRMTGKLAAMGIVPGAIIVKKSSSPMRGPVVLKKGLSQFAIGYGMAWRVMVERLGG
jgi:Fe2+ transport system protein FeoA